MNDTPSIRPLGESDLADVLRLWAASEGLGHGPGDTAEDLARFLRRNPGLSLGAFDANGPVAAILCGHDGRRGFIYRLAVGPAHRRRGLATALVRRSLEGLRAEGIPRCQVFVLADNTAARSFWAALGGVLREDLCVLSLPVS